MLRRPVCADRGMGSEERHQDAPPLASEAHSGASRPWVALSADIPSQALLGPITIYIVYYAASASYRALNWPIRCSDEPLSHEKSLSTV